MLLSKHDYNEEQSKPEMREAGGGQVGGVTTIYS